MLPKRKGLGLTHSMQQLFQSCSATHKPSDYLLQITLCRKKDCCQFYGENGQHLSKRNNLICLTPRVETCQIEVLPLLVQV